MIKFFKMSHADKADPNKIFAIAKMDSVHLSVSLLIVCPQFVLSSERVSLSSAKFGSSNIKQQDSCDLPAVLLLLFLAFSLKASCLRFMLFCLSMNVFFFLNFIFSPGGNSVITRLLSFEAFLDLLVWTDLLPQRILGSNWRWKVSKRLKLQLFV